MNVILLPLLLSVSTGAGATLATQSSTSQPAQATALEITAEGAFLHRSRSELEVELAGTQGLTAAGSLWTHTSGVANWIPLAVSIGDLGGQVFAQYSLNNEAAELFSSYDSNPPTALWTNNTPFGLEFSQVDSASGSDVHVAMHQEVLGGNNLTRQAVVRRFDSSSSTPAWTYTFAPIINAGSKVAVSRDGSTIVAAILNDNTMSMEIAVFGANSATPLSYTVLAPGSSSTLRGWDLSADGSTLYFTQGTVAHIFDVATTSVVFTTNIGGSFDSHAISGDGSVFAFGHFNWMKVWEKSGGSYTNTITKTLGGQVFCARIDISDDSSTVAYGWYFYNPGLTVQVNALDVATDTVTMSEQVSGVGGFQNLISDISCSADGSRFAVGMWGDEGNQAEEVRIYSSTQDAPIATVNLPGSVFKLDMSADGQRVVAGSKAVHANTMGNGGQVDLVDSGDQDFAVRGVPSVGATVNFEIHGTPGVPAFLIAAPLPEDPPVTFPSLGTLYVKRSALTIYPLGPVPAGGVLTAPFSLPSGAGLIGTPQYFQAFFLAPRVLTADWAKLTLLP